MILKDLTGRISPWLGAAEMAEEEKERERVRKEMAEEQEKDDAED